MSYEVETDNFSGPLDLLYRLIKDKEIEINEISLARVADQYLAYLRASDEFDLEEASHFTRIGAELLEIKARSLLPSGSSGEKEEENPLVARLKEHKLVKELAGELDELRSGSGVYFSRHLRGDIRENLQLHIESGPQELYELVDVALKSFAQRRRERRKKNKLVNLARESITVQEKINEMLEILEESDDKYFLSDFVSGGRMEAAVALLALLELSFRDAVKLKQKRRFGRIAVIPREGDQKEYGQ